VLLCCCLHVALAVWLPPLALVSTAQRLEYETHLVPFNASMPVELDASTRRAIVQSFRVKALHVAVPAVAWLYVVTSNGRLPA
jgi:hypothetical protein